MREPKNSCPDINQLQGGLKVAIKELETVDCEKIDRQSIRYATRMMDDAIDEMEEVRKINEQLREYANYWRQEHDNLLREVGSLERLVEELKEKVEYA